MSCDKMCDTALNDVCFLGAAKGIFPSELCLFMLRCSLPLGLGCLGFPRPSAAPSITSAVGSS